MIFSCVIPALDKNDPKLKDLITSIRNQDFPQDKIEILVMGPEHGDSEQAKAAGIRQAKGDICAMFCADNKIMDKNLFFKVYYRFWGGAPSAVYTARYHYKKDDNSLNRYFSLIGGNDPVCYYLGKNDREPHVYELRRSANYQPSFGCNGFFYRSEQIKATDLDHYYPMDNAMEIEGGFYPIDSDSIWHRTSDDLISFLKKRYRYARDLYCDREDRRWKMVDTKEDYRRLVGFSLCALAVIPCFFTSLRGFFRIKDLAWFWHWPVCLGFLITYGLLTCRNLIKHRSLSLRPGKTHSATA